MKILREPTFERRVSLRHIFPHEGQRATHCATATERVSASAWYWGQFALDSNETYQTGLTALIAPRGPGGARSITRVPLDLESIETLLALPTDAPRRRALTRRLAAAICERHWCPRGHGEFEERYARALHDLRCGDAPDRTLCLSLTQRRTRSWHTTIALEARGEEVPVSLTVGLVQYVDVPYHGNENSYAVARLLPADLELLVGYPRFEEKDRGFRKIRLARKDAQEIHDQVFRGFSNSLCPMQILTMAADGVDSASGLPACAHPVWRTGLLMLLDAYRIPARLLRERLTRAI